MKELVQFQGKKEITVEMDWLAIDGKLVKSQRNAHLIDLLDTTNNQSI